MLASLKIFPYLFNYLYIRQINNIESIETKTRLTTIQFLMTNEFNKFTIEFDQESKGKLFSLQQNHILLYI
jgi:hypothetical protein